MKDSSMYVIIANVWGAAAIAAENWWMFIAVAYFVFCAHRAEKERLDYLLSKNNSD